MSKPKIILDMDSDSADGVEEILVDAGVKRDVIERAATEEDPAHE